MAVFVVVMGIVVSLAAVDAVFVVVAVDNVFVVFAAVVYAVVFLRMILMTGYKLLIGSHQILSMIIPSFPKKNTTILTSLSIVMLLSLGLWLRMSLL